MSLRALYDMSMVVKIRNDKKNVMNGVGWGLIIVMRVHCNYTDTYIRDDEAQVTKIMGAKYILSSGN